MSRWTFNRQPREEWPQWLQEARVGSFMSPGGDGLPEHLKISVPGGVLMVDPGDIVVNDDTGIHVIVG